MVSPIHEIMFGWCGNYGIWAKTIALLGDNSEATRPRWWKSMDPI